MCGLFPCIPILGVFIFDQKVLREWEFKFLCETNTLGSCKTHYLSVKYFAILTGKHLCLSLSLIKLENSSGRCF